METQEGERQEGGERARKLSPEDASFGATDKTPVQMPEFLSSNDFGIEFLKVLFHSHTPLGNYCKASCHRNMMDCNTCNPEHLWPCPLPAVLAAPATSLVGRRRTRWKLRSMIREHLRCFVATSNWIVLGRPKTLQTVIRQPPSKPQQRMLDFLEKGLRCWYRLSSGYSSDLDRSFGKFCSLEETFSKLDSALGEVRSHLDPYGKRRSAKVDGTTSGAADVSGQPVVCKPAGGLTALNVEPDRLVFKHSPDFHAENYINDPLLKAGFLNPVHLRLPKADWPRTRHARVMCSRTKLLELFKKWDSVNCLQLIPVSNSERKYRCGLFAVYKNEVKDRQILNPVPENSRTMPLNDSTTSLAHGNLLCGVFLEPDQQLVIGADDLEDFYHSYVVPPAHAARNHIHGVFDANIFQGWNCWDTNLDGKQVVGCFNTLAMGTSYAVEVAQHSHTNLLRRAGCLNPSQQVKYRTPLPRGNVLQLLCIDDFCVLQKISVKTPEPRQDLSLLSQAGEAYKKAGLRTSEKKSVRNSYRGTVLGAEVDGKLGSVSAPRLRTLALCRLTLILVRVGFTTKHLLESLLGCWIFVLLFRRPLFCLLSDVFHEGSDYKPHHIFQLSVGAKQELLLLCMYAPWAATNLRAEPLARLFASDASLDAAGVCSCSASRQATLELCRVAEQKGFYTKVNTGVLGELLATGTMIGDDDLVIPPALEEGFIWDFFEIFRGCGTLSRAHQRLGLRVHPGFEIADGDTGDVLNSATMLCIIGLICRRVIRFFHVAPVCTTFGTLRRPRLRSKQQPSGFDLEDACTHEGNRFAWRTIFILNLCITYGLNCSVEQPGGSVMYRLEGFRKLLRRGVSLVRFPFCGWGTPFRKLSAWLVTNPLLQELNAKCTCGREGQHFQVRGVFDRERLGQFLRSCRPSCKVLFERDPFLGEHVAHFSSRYPRTLCDFVATKNLEMLNLSHDYDEEAAPLRPFSSPPQWMSELARSMTWKKLLQFRFRKRNHINIDENLSYRSLLKHLSKHEPHSRFCALLDSRVVIGSSAKGRSSSKQLNFYMSTSVPYIIGGDLYPYLLHVGSPDNPSDDISRFVDLRGPSLHTPKWLQSLLAGDYRAFDVVHAADKLKQPWNRWARFIGLLQLRHATIRQ